MAFTHDIAPAKTTAGITDSDLASHFAALKIGIATLADWRKNRTLPMLNLAEDETDLAEIEEVGGWFRKNFSTLLVVGTGGSSLGGQTLVALKENTFAAGKLGAPRIFFLDNVDPVTMDMLLSTVDLSQTGVLVISKSGGTAEIIAQTLVLVSVFKEKLGEESIAKQWVSITEPTDNPLRRLSTRYKIRTLEHDPKLGGRFSVLSRVGLIPAAAAGLDVRKIRKGAAKAIRELLDNADAPEKAASAIGAALHVALLEKGRDIAVLMPYSDRLAYFGMWFRQLWAESLGKDGKGTTPIRAMGTVDQHSQLQLYLDGPQDKFFTLILPETAGQGPRIDAALVQEESLAYIRDQRIGDVMAAYQHGTTQSLVEGKCPVRVLRVKDVNEESLGALLQHFMLETVLTAHLLGVNAYDQPAVEGSKIFAREYLSSHAPAAEHPVPHMARS
ncbi:MAG: glucose-6-phosphate isomerase [Alphaproteobacteria bacterium]|nr:glucose-6-phosphate isomerase [Alphaproteobacteria bacterium]